MTAVIKKGRYHQEISKGRHSSIVLYEDGTTQMAIDSNSVSVVLHLSKEDTEFIVDALHGGSHA